MVLSTNLARAIHVLEQEDLLHIDLGSTEIGIRRIDVVKLRCGKTLITQGGLAEQVADVDAGAAGAVNSYLVFVAHDCLLSIRKGSVGKRVGFELVVYWA